eukprot:Opistho-2@13268
MSAACRVAVQRTPPLTTCTRSALRVTWQLVTTLPGPTITPEPSWKPPEGLTASIFSTLGASRISEARSTSAIAASGRPRPSSKPAATRWEIRRMEPATALGGGMDGSLPRGRGRVVVEQRHVEVAQDGRDLGPQLLDQRLDLLLPLTLAIAHAHRHREIELDARLRAHRHDHQLRLLHLLREVAADRPPHDGGIDLAAREVLLDDLARILLRVRVHDLVGHALLDQLVLVQPLRCRRAVVEADAQLLELRAIECEKVVDRLHTIETLARRVDQRIGRSVVRLGGRYLVIAGRHAHDDVAAEILARQLVAQRVSHEGQTLRERVVLDRQTELLGEQLGDLVLVALSVEAGKRQVVRILADAEGLARRRRLLRDGRQGRAGQRGQGQHAGGDGFASCGARHWISSTLERVMAPSERPLRYA